MSDEQRKILVTGATGKIGKHLVLELQRAGFTVRGQYKTSSGSDPNIEWHNADFSDQLDSDALVAGCVGVIHLAAELHQSELMEEVNVEATGRLAQAAAQAGIRYFGFASSVVVYGSPLNADVNEASPRLDPTKPILPHYRAEVYMRDYARSKAAAEIALEALKTDMTIDLYRPSVVIESRELLGSRNWGKARKVLNLYRQTQFIIVQELCRSIVHLLKRGLDGTPRQEPVEAFNLADASAGTYRDLHKIGQTMRPDLGFYSGVDIPHIADIVATCIKYRTLAPRLHLGMLHVNNSKLLGTGFKFRAPMSDVFRGLISA